MNGEEIKVLFFIQSLSIGGKERRLVELVRSLKQKTRLHATLVLMENNIQFENAESYFDEIIILNKRRYSKDWRVFIEFLKVCKRAKPHIIHAWGLMESVYAVPTKILLRVPLITSMIADAIPQKKSISVNRMLIRIAAFFANSILSNSYAGIRAYRVHPKKTSVIYNGFDFRRIEPSTKSYLLRKEIGCEGKKIVLMVASFNQYKDYDLFLDVSAETHQKRGNIVFIALGEGPFREKMMSRADKEGITNVIMPGRKTNVHDYISIADVCVLFSPYEGISNAIIEYMAHKKPVIATSLGGTEEVIENNITGYNLNGASAAYISERIIALLDDDSLSQKLGTNGYETIQQKFSITQMTDGIADIYFSLHKTRN